MPELKGNGHFQIFKAIFAAMRTKRDQAKIESRLSPSNKMPSVVSHSVEPRPTLRIATASIIPNRVSRSVPEESYACAVFKGVLAHGLTSRARHRSAVQTYMARTPPSTWISEPVM